MEEEDVRTQVMRDQSRALRTSFVETHDEWSVAWRWLLMSALSEASAVVLIRNVLTSICGSEDDAGR